MCNLAIATFAVSAASVAASFAQAQQQADAQTDMHNINQKTALENYQQQIGQLNKTLEKANASIHDFAQVRLLEFKQPKIDAEPQPAQDINTPAETVSEKKRRRWFF